MQQRLAVGVLLPIVRLRHAPNTVDPAGIEMSLDLCSVFPLAALVFRYLQSLSFPHIAVFVSSYVILSRPDAEFMSNMIIALPVRRSGVSDGEAPFISFYYLLCVCVLITFLRTRLTG